MSRQLILEKVDSKPGRVYYPLRVETVPVPSPGPGEYLVKMHAAALNHRDHFVRQHLYPRISLSSPMLADGCGTVTAAGPGADKSLIGRRVIPAPCAGWASSPDGPEDLSKFAVCGSTAVYPDKGTARDYLVAAASDLELAPDHLTPAQAAAIPVVGLTAWRALVTKSNAWKAGSNILVTGIGGGVALMALQLAVAKGCAVWVTSSDASKIKRAEALGARGGVSYREDGWEKALLKLLPRDRPLFDAIIDGAGGDIAVKAPRLLKAGGVISSYGMTVSPLMDWHMAAVLKNIELRGTTMGSREEFRDMMAFVRRERIVPVVSRSVRGLDNLEAIDGLFEDLREGRQFGKLVIEIEGEGQGQGQGQAKL